MKICVNGYKTFFNYLLFKERLRKIFKRKNTFLHYLSVPNWKIKNYQVLVNDVQQVDKIDPFWNQRYVIPKGEDIKETKPTIAKAIDTVLSKGVITERSIFNLATSEKLIFIHKYAEGFSKTWKQQDVERKRLLAEKERWTKSKAKDAERHLKKVNDSISNLNSNWLVAPIRYALEDLGFQKLFSNLDGVYVLPLSLIPEQYHKEPEQYINDIVIKVAKEYLDSIDIDEYDYIEDINESLKYLILLHVVPVNQLKIISRERNIEISSPELSRMLFTTYLSSDSSNLSNLYINDVVRNVDFKSQLKNNKTGNYLLNNLEFIKTHLWRQHHIDIYKPQTLSSLTPNHIRDIGDILVEHDDSVAKWRIEKQITDIVIFYQQLNEELNEIRR